MNDPTPSATAATPPDARGSRWLGFALFWLIIVVGNGVSGIAISLARRLFHGAAIAYMLVGLLPWVAMLALAIWYASKGQTRTAQGIAFGFLSLVGLALLLVAACFGILLVGGFGNMH